MHLTLKQETANPPANSRRAQQRVFDRFRKVYNEDRPHEALEQHTPESLYRPSTRPFSWRPSDPELPPGYLDFLVEEDGTITWRGRPVYISQSLTGEIVGLKEVADNLWQVNFGPIVVGSFRKPRKRGAQIKLQQKQEV